MNIGMHMIRQFLLLLQPAKVLLLVFVATMASSPARATLPCAWEETDPLLALAGVDSHLNLVHRNAVGQVRSRTANLPADQRILLVAAAEEAYDPAALWAVVTATVNARMEPRHAQDVLAFLRSDRGRLVTAMEVAAAAEDFSTADTTPDATLMDVSASRLKLAKRIDVATGATELAVAIALDLVRAQAIVTGAIADPATADLLLERRAVNLRAALADQALHAVLRTYRGLSDHELGAYAAFLESDAGRWFYATTALALRAALATAALEMGEMQKELPGSLLRLTV